MDAYAFAQLLIAELQKLCPEAEPLKVRKARDGADLGIEEDGEFEPLLRVKNASKAVNVMSLWVYHRDRWQPTFVRGTPAQIAEKLRGPFAYLWRIPVLAMSFVDEPRPSTSARPTVRRRPRRSP